MLKRLLSWKRNNRGIKDPLNSLWPIKLTDIDISQVKYTKLTLKYNSFVLLWWKTLKNLILKWKLKIFVQNLRFL